MKVLVTGGSGFIGRRVVARLQRDARFEIVVASRTIDPIAGVVAERVDLLAPGAAADLIERVRPTHLLHLAWNATPGVFWSAADNLDWSAVTLVLMRAFLEAGGRRAVLAGTCAEYDWTGEGRLSETSLMNPATLYGRVKDATRRAVCAAGDSFGVPVGWGRVFWLYGPEEALGRLVSDVARAVVEGRTVETSSGEQRRDFLHVDDVARAFLAALDSDWHGPFNIGSGEAVPIRTVIEEIASVVGRPDLIHFGKRPRPPNDPDLLEADVRILRDIIGFAPKIPLKRGLSHTIEWWRGRSRPLGTKSSIR